MSHALLTCDRGDRPKMMGHCIEQCSRFSTGFDHHILINYMPISKGFDLTERFKHGYESAKESGFDWIIVIESDDFYPADYLENIIPHMDKSDFIGSEFSYYYNIKTRSYERLLHPNRSSMFTTAFRVSAMKDFKWHLAHKLFLDIDIWRHARKYRTTFIDAGAVGIKGSGEGMHGGKGHTMKLANKDPDLKWLSSKVDSESLAFYKTFGE